MAGARPARRSTSHTDKPRHASSHASSLSGHRHASWTGSLSGEMPLGSHDGREIVDRDAAQLEVAVVVRDLRSQPL